MRRALCNFLHNSPKNVRLLKAGVTTENMESDVTLQPTNRRAFLKNQITPGLTHPLAKTFQTWDVWIKDKSALHRGPQSEELS